jgi:hypothetical protein
MPKISLHNKQTIFKLLFCLVFLFTFLVPALPVAAEDSNNDPTYNLQVDIPGMNKGINVSEPETAIGGYISAIYNYAIGVVGILAALVIMIGGLIWLTAGGNTNRIEKAKSWITGALTGLVIALASYAILYTVNPDLVNLQIREDIESYEGEEIGCCVYTQNGDKQVMDTYTSHCEEQEGSSFYPNKVALEDENKCSTKDPCTHLSCNLDDTGDPEISTRVELDARCADCCQDHGYPGGKCGGRGWSELNASTECECRH